VTQPRFHLAKRDAIEWLASLPGESVDLVITDPAYESLEKHRKIGTTTRLKQSDASSNEWFSIFPNSRFPEFFVEVFRVLRPDRHFYMYCDQETMFVTKPMAEAAGFKFHKPIVWDKVSIGMGYHYRARYEFILFFEKGYRKLADLGTADIITHKRINGGYPTEKPTGVSKVLIEQSSTPGEIVVDPFMGSGSVGVAAVTHGRHFFGGDVSDKSHELARSRIAEHATETVELPPRMDGQLGLGIR
jgi:site-specific DNA-methyltransferase (adenine-specific)